VDTELANFKALAIGVVDGLAPSPGIGAPIGKILMREVINLVTRAKDKQLSQRTAEPIAEGAPIGGKISKLVEQNLELQAHADGV
jgi:hypothetical protein